jgi:hypothetical protein
MDNNENTLDNSLVINKEEKYRAEIFELLKSTIDINDLEMIALFNDLFLSDSIDNNQLLKKIISLK